MNERKQTSRERILEGARQVFASTEFTRVRVEDLLKAAGVSRPTFYRLFHNKDEVYELLEGKSPRVRSVTDRLTEGAREVFQELGCARARVDDILVASGLSRPTFYRYFSGKQELYEHMDEKAVRYLVQGIEKRLRGEPDSDDFLVYTLDSYLDWRAACGLELVGNAEASSSPGLARVRAELVASAREGLDREQVLGMQALLSLVESFASAWMERGEADDAARSARRALLMGWLMPILVQQLGAPEELPPGQ